MTSIGDLSPAFRHVRLLLAREAGMSPYHFLRTFRQVAGVTPHQYVLRTRLNRAAVRLRTCGEPISAIAFDAGFGDLSTFNRRFRRLMGCSPGAYRAGDRFACGRAGCPTTACHPALVSWAQAATDDPRTVAGWWRDTAYTVLLATGRAFDVVEVPAYLGAPTVASSRGMCSNGSQPKKRATFSCVILLISSSVQFDAFSSSISISGDRGHVESECG